MAEVHKLKPEIVGDGYRFDADEILEDAKGAEFVTLAIIAEYVDGGIYIAGNANGGETLVLMERAKEKIVFGDRHG